MYELLKKKNTKVHKILYPIFDSKYKKSAFLLVRKEGLPEGGSEDKCRRRSEGQESARTGGAESPRSS